jgi:hypothetical protein
MNDLGTPDPQWDFALAIRTALELHGRFVTEIDERDAQARVDVQWAARQAGRLLGAQVSIELSAPHGRSDFIVTATVRCADPDPVERSRADVGLQKLLQSVHEAQHFPCSSAVVPHPRAAAGRPLRHRPVVLSNVHDVRS